MPRWLEREREKESESENERRIERQRRNGLDFTDFRILRFLGIALACTQFQLGASGDRRAVIMATTCVLQKLPYRQKSFQVAVERRFTN